MALDDGKLKSMIISNLKGFGFIANDHGKMNEMAEAIAKAVVKHVKDDGEVIVMGGGSYSGEKAKIE